MVSPTSFASKSLDSGEKELSMYKYDHNVTRSLAIGPINSKFVIDPTHKASPFKDVIGRMTLDENIKTLATKIFNTVAQTGALLPWINYYDGGLLLIWDNDGIDQPRILYIFIHPAHSVRYQLSKRAVVDNDYDWKFITDSDKIFAMVNYLGHYLEGTVDNAEPPIQIR
jgi:hypothetical protein